MHVPAVNTASAAKAAKTIANKRNLADTLAVLAGFSGVPAALITVPVVDAHLRYLHMDDHERKLLVNQEIARQIVGTGLHVLFYFLGMWGTGQFTRNSKHKALMQFIGGTVLTTIAHGVIRPLMTNELFVKYLYNTGDNNNTAYPTQSRSFPVKEGGANNPAISAPKPGSISLLPPSHFNGQRIPAVPPARLFSPILPSDSYIFHQNSGATLQPATGYGAGAGYI